MAPLKPSVDVPKSGEAKLPKPPQGHGGIREPVKRNPPRSGDGPPIYVNGSSKPRLLQAAIEVAEVRGYESMRIADVTDKVGVTRQAFYAHFRDKRHCLAEALGPQLAEIERMASSAGPEDAAWATQIIRSVDEAIAERFESPEGTRSRLIDAMIELLREHESMNPVTVGKLVKAAHVPQGDFYKTFAGKKECYAVAYEKLLSQLVSEVEEQCTAEHSGHGVTPFLETLGVRLEADPVRCRILLVGAAQLPEQESDDSAGAWRGSLAEAVEKLLSGCRGVDPEDPQLPFVASSVVEVIRSSTLTEEAGPLDTRLTELGTAFVEPILVEQQQAPTTARLAA